jgi:sulfite reductase (NADPH) flavoprotein alpha-component
MSLFLIPESAPFNIEQRAWLNGFLAGWLGLQDSPAATPIAAPTALTPVEDFPWHDPALPIAERLSLAENAPLPHRLMSAMAQLDCGACGYLCRTYSEAIASGEETSLTLCSPGGSETSKAVKRLVNGAAKRNPPSNGVIPETHGWSRKKPYPASILRSLKLNGPGSDKETCHVELDLNGSGLSYKVGDSLGVIPTNCHELVEELISTLGASGDEPVSSPSKTFRDALTRDVCLTEITEDLLRVCLETATDFADAEAIRPLQEDDGPLAGHDVLDLLNRFPSARPRPADLIRGLTPIRPRLYSISSSPTRHAGQVHLTVAKVSYVANGRVRKGVASTMFADRVGPGSQARVFVQPSHGFTVPADPNASMIMIGPGTGIAPFRAFLHERDAVGAKGKNWLFFGDQRGECDFLYEEELRDLRTRGVLTRLDTAFSRDQHEKIYVQHRLLEHGQELFQWLEDGAHVFVCGDAKRMATDVDRALREVISTHGARDEVKAREYVQELAAAGRYLRDVY